MSRKKTHEEFVKEVYELVGDSYIVDGIYQNNSTKIKFIHNSKSCKHVFYKSPQKFLAGQRCTGCLNEEKTMKLRKKHNEFIKKVFELVGDEYYILGQYSSAKTKIKIKHYTCGTIYEVTPDHFKRGQRCPACFGNQMKTTEIFKSRVFELVGDEYEVLGDYKGCEIKIKMKHKKCEHEYEVEPRGFLQGNRCPKCVFSKGEATILQFLNDNQIKNEHQYKFEDCKNVRSLRFDFAILKDDKLEYLIEYDGIQHFKSRDIFGGEEYLIEVELHDQIKNTYCKENDIPLYRIPYWKFNEIESILDKLINNKPLEVDETSFLVQ